MGERPISIQQRKLLVGEGHDELEFFSAMLEHLKLPDVQVMQYGGKGNLSRWLKTIAPQFREKQVESILIARDVDPDDGSADKVLESLRGLLGSHRLPCPDQTGQFSTGTPRVGIWLMPDNQSVGTLEDLCLAAVDGDSRIGCVDGLFQCIDSEGLDGPRLLSKSKVAAWLATLPPRNGRDDIRLGLAAKQGVWPWGNEAFQPMIELVKQL